MRRLSSLLILLLSAVGAAADPPPIPLPFVQVTPNFFYNPLQVSLYGPGSTGRDCSDPALPCDAVYFMTHLPAGGNLGPQTADTPITVDLTPYGVSADAKVAQLTGIMIITHGSTVEIADMWLTFAAAAASIDCTKYIGQVVEASLEGGQRSPLTVMVPLTNGKFQYCYHVTTPGAWPTNSSYGVNMSVQAYWR